MNVVKNSTTAGYDFYDTSAAVSYKYTCTSTDIDNASDATKKVEGCTTAADEGKSVDRTGTITFANLDKFLFFNDSSMFAYEAADTASGCTSGNNCLGIIDINGAKGPNKVVSSATSPTDIYPVVFYDQTILPASEVASEVLYSK